MNKDISDRMERALSQRMYLLNSTGSENNWLFLIEGSTGTQYQINFNEQYVKCKCIDFNKRKKICKHIMFIICRILKDIPLLGLLDEDPNIDIFILFKKINKKDLNEILNNILNRPDIALLQLHSKKPDITEIEIDYECAICYEDLDKLSVSCQTCKKYIHSLCIQRCLKQKNNCPLCRSVWYKKTESDDALSKFNK